jgi:murein DD-endopeptidase MepM/ murein hydrolase activator NlpD
MEMAMRVFCGLALAIAAVSNVSAAESFVGVAAVNQGVMARNTPDYGDFAFTGSAVQGGVLRGRAPDDIVSLQLDGMDVYLAEDRHFLIAFDRDAPNQQRLRIMMRDGRTVDLAIAVAPGKWRLEHINAPIRGNSSSNADFQKRRSAELAQIAAARDVIVESNGWRQNFIWPVTGRYSGSFGAQRIYQGFPGSYHSGADIAAPRGTTFVAPADGVVVLAARAPFTLEGNLLIISHGAGLNSAFLHCDRLDVKVGDVVRQGQALGIVGATGRATGPHMHWGMKWGLHRVSPALFIF